MRSIVALLALRTEERRMTVAEDPAAFVVRASYADLSAAARLQLRMAKS